MLRWSFVFMSLGAACGYGGRTGLARPACVAELLFFAFVVTGALMLLVALASGEPRRRVETAVLRAASASIREVTPVPAFAESSDGQLSLWNEMLSDGLSYARRVVGSSETERLDFVVDPSLEHGSPHQSAFA